MAKQSFTFALTFVAFFALAFIFLAWVDALPDAVTQDTSASDTTTVEQPVQEQAALTASGEEPVRIVAASIGLDKTVLNPTSDDAQTLDDALLKGTVHYPGSALLGVPGTMLIFGHSSYLPIVHNENYKAFDGIQKLKEGDIVSVYSAGVEYRYAVSSVTTATADEDQILRLNLPKEGTRLMLVTCDSFGSKSTRFVVTADFQGAYTK